MQLEFLFISPLPAYYCRGLLERELRSVGVH